eukprot:TRINITY_DN2851_c0_g2_i1.p1 TRINITY_DN2851_c0_g2~~TRINITY_DN2851_c0_g2_i1.p1  ORF type:complete len:123 (+),score=24.26 TRINITY_DN2851_c0_g2_i1:123-491(+)
MSFLGVHQLKRLVVSFCDHSGSSKGARDFVKTFLPELRTANPQLEVEESLRRGLHPFLRGFYANGKTRTVDVKNKDAEEVLHYATALRNAAGHKVIKLKSRHTTTQPSIQGMWTPRWSSVEA